MLMLFTVHEPHQDSNAKATTDEFFSTYGFKPDLTAGATIKGEGENPHLLYSRCSEASSLQTDQPPAIVIPSTRTVGASVPRRSRKSLAGVMCKNISPRLPAMVISATGSANAPSRIINPAAPPL